MNARALRAAVLALLVAALVPRLKAAPAAVPTDDGALFTDAARPAWRFVASQYQPATGFISAVGGYHHATIWDVASGLAALYCARELGFLDQQEYDRRLRRALASLRAVPLFQGVAFHRSYSTRALAVSSRRRRGSGWSPTDIGRLLVWLKVIAVHQPQYQPEVESIVRRLDAGRIVRHGYLWGARVDAKEGLKEYQEGRIGYEQYAAAGFKLWGFPVETATDLEANALPMTVMGKPVLADARAYDRLTSEPLVLLGLELGWTKEMRRLAEGVLAAQQERWRRTGRMTVVSEDAIGRAPHYFYYYCVYANAKEFAIDVQDPRAVVSGPRWVSAKAAYAWHALLPSEYTRRAVEAVGAARAAGGWGSGIYEVDGRSTRTANINTQAVILEAVLYRARGRPLLGEKGSEG